MILTVEEQGGGCQMVRFRLWPRISRTVAVLTVIFAALSGAAAFDGANAGAVLLAAVAAVLFMRMLAETGSAMSALSRAIRMPR